MGWLPRWPPPDTELEPEPSTPGVNRGTHRGITKSPKREKRRGRR